MESTSIARDGASDDIRIQFLYFASCPNAQAALAFLRDTLRAEGIGSEIELITVETEEAAQQHNFIGSPTIRVNDVDISQPMQPVAPSLACRIYRDSEGHHSSHPTVEALTQALNAARHHTTDA